MKKLGLSLAIAAALGLSACGGSSGGSSGGNSSSSTVTGTASKGIIVGGLVSAYLFDSSGVPETTAIATAVTDSAGEYSLTIPSEHEGKPVFIVVDDNDGAASMKCDIAGGCDNDGDGTVDVEFGASLDLAAGDLSLSAVLPESTETVSVNVTPLTTVAATLAQSVIESGTVSEFNIQEAVNNANSQVADRFGLTQDITKIPVVDLTDPEAVAAQLGDDAEVVQYAAINAAIVSAVQDDDATDSTSINEAIESFAESFVDSGLSDNAVSDDVTDLGDILEDAQAVIQEVEDDIVALGEEFADAVTDIQSLEDDVAADETLADEAVASDDGDQGTASETANATNLAQVKAFVEELRELGTAIDSSLVGDGEGQDTVANILDGFDLQMEAADLASSDDVGNAVEGMAEALGAMSIAYENNFDFETGGLLTPSEENEAELTSLPADVVVEGITVNISQSEGAIVLSVDETVVIEDDSGIAQNVSVDMMGTVVDFTIDDDSTEYENYNESTNVYTWGDEGTVSGSLDIDVTGTASVGTVLVTLEEGSGLEAEANLSYEGNGTEGQSSGSYDDYLNATVTDFDADFNVSIEQTEAGEGQSDGPMSFTGMLGLEASIGRFIEDTEDTWNNTESGWSNSESEDLTLRSAVVGISLQGTFANQENSFEASIALNGDATGVTFREIYSYDESYSQQNGWSYNDSNSDSGETTSNWSDLSANLSFSADLQGVADAIDFSFDVERSGYDDADFSLSLAYPGRTIDIEAAIEGIDTDGATAEMTLTNNDGVVITVTGDESISEEDGQFTIEIRKDTNEDGVVDEDDFLYAWYEVRNGIELLVFADDQDADNIEFESLF